MTPDRLNSMDLTDVKENRVEDCIERIVHLGTKYWEGAKRLEELREQGYRAEKDPVNEAIAIDILKLRAIDAEEPTELGLSSTALEQAGVAHELRIAREADYARAANAATSAINIEFLRESDFLHFLQDSYQERIDPIIKKLI